MHCIKDGNSVASDVTVSKKKNVVQPNEVDQLCLGRTGKYTITQITILYPHTCILNCCTEGKDVTFQANYSYLIFDRLPLENMT